MAQMENKGQAAQQASNQAAGMMDKARDAAGNLANQARDAATNVADQARQGGPGGLAGQASHLADQARSAVSHLGDQASQYASQAAHAVRDQMGGAGHAVSDTFQRGADYFQQGGLDGVTDDLGAMIRRNPLPAVLVGVGVGFLLGRMMRS